MAKFDLSFNHSNALPGPSAWEKFLLGAGVAENSCSQLVLGRTRKGRDIRSWVREHYTKNYVPEIVLETLGLHKRVMNRWPQEE